MDRFEVSAPYAPGGIGVGQVSARMDWRYKVFSKETIKQLTRATL